MPRDLDTDMGSSTTPQLTFDRFGTLHLFYAQSDQGGQTEIRHRTKPPAVDWEVNATVRAILSNGSTLGHGVGVTGMASDSRPR